MNYRSDNSNFQNKKLGNNNSMPENPGRRSFMICTALITAAYIYRGGGNSGSNDSIESTKRTAMPTDRVGVTVDSTHVAIGAGEHQGFRIC